MKNKLLIIICTVLGFTSCTKDIPSTDMPKGELATVTVKLDNTAKTRAAYDNPTLSDMRVILTVSSNGQYVCSETIPHHDFTTSQVTFTLRLVSDQKYTISCWADFGEEYYLVSGTTVTMLAAHASDNKRDAYFAFANDVEFGATNSTLNLTITRPLGLVKISTTDYNTQSVKNGYRPTKYRLTTKSAWPTSMSLIDGLSCNPQVITLEGDVAGQYNVDSNPKELSFDYFFATDNRTDIAFEVLYYTPNGEITYNFTGIPLQRNYRSNISGNIITKAGGLTVDIEPGEGYYAVTFNSNGGSAVSPVVVAAGDKVVRPILDPTKEDFLFEGWYTDVDCILPWNFDTEVVSSILMPNGYLTHRLPVSPILLNSTQLFPILW